MNYRKTVTYILIPAVILVILLLIAPSNRGVPVFDILLDTNSFTEPLGIALLGIIPTMIILLFTPKKVFMIWKKFAVPYIVIAAILLFFAGDGGGGFLGGSLVDGEILAWFFAILFFIISITIIGIKSFMLRRENKDI